MSCAKHLDDAQDKIEWYSAYKQCQEWCWEPVCSWSADFGWYVKLNSLTCVITIDLRLLRVQKGCYTSSQAWLVSQIGKLHSYQNSP